MIDYEPWEVIENGATLPKTNVVEGVTTEVAKKLLEAVEKIFGRNAATKKTQKNLLKQQYENFTAPSSEMLYQTFDRLQKLRNKANLDTMSMDDLYNNLKAVNTAHEVSTARAQVNAAYFININNVSDVIICSFFASQPNSPQLVHEVLEKIYPDDIEEMDLRWQMAMLTMMARSFLKKIGRKLTINGSETIGFDKSNVECYNCHKKRHFAGECGALKNKDNKQKESSSMSVPIETSTSTALVSYDGNFMPPTPNLSFTGLDEFVNKPVVENCKAKSSEEEPMVVKKNDDALIIKEWVSDNKEDDVSQPNIEKKIVKPSIVKKEFGKSKQQDKTTRKLFKQVEQHTQNSQSSRGNKRN
nr:hypothetical protein [Tanacetum cinerariifolium]